MAATWQYLLQVRPFDVVQTPMNVCMRQPVVHAIQLYDIIPAKRRRIEKLNFGGKEIKMKNESCVTLELRTLCGDRRMRVRETADEGRG